YRMVLPVAQGTLDLFAPGWPDARGEVLVMRPDHRFNGLVMALCDLEGRSRCIDAVSATLSIVPSGDGFAGTVEADFGTEGTIRADFIASRIANEQPLICG